MQESSSISGIHEIKGVGRLKTICFLFILFMLALGVRTWNWPQVFRPDGFRMLEGDAMYHTKRILHAAGHNLTVPAFDPWLNFPQGNYCNWPPLFDQVIAAGACLLAGGAPSPALAETTAALAPPLIGALTALLMFFVCRRFTTPLFAFLGALLFCFLPFHIQLSVTGRPDHHVAVVLIASLLFLTLPRISSARSTSALFIRTGLAGLVLAAGLLVWPGFLLPILVTALSAAVFLCLPYRPPLHGSALALPFAWAALLLMLLMPDAPAPSTQIHFSGLNTQHASLLIAIAAFLYLQAWLLNILHNNSGQSSRGSQVLLRLAGWLVLACASCWFVFQQDLASQLLSGSAFLGKQDPFLRHIKESLPLTWQTAMENFSGLILLAPILIFQQFHKKDRVASLADLSLLTTWTLVIGTAAILQERFSDLFSITAAIYAALGLESMTHFAIQREGSQRTCRIATAGVFLALALFMPARWLTGTYFPSARVAYPDPLYDLCTWMRDNTPTQPYPDGQPTYSVLASWTGGHPITVIGHRANVANGFVGWEETRESSLLPYRFFTETDPDKAMSLLRSCKARYVILGDMISSGEFARVIDILDLRHENFFQSNPTPSGTLFSPTPLLRTTMAARLFFHDAAGMENDFHLVYASPCLHSNGKPVLKLFEVINQPPSL